MGINKGQRFAKENVYVDYPFEDVTYRWDHASQQVFVRFYGKQESREPIPLENRLFGDALRYGDEMTQAEYERGK